MVDALGFGHAQCHTQFQRNILLRHNTGTAGVVNIMVDVGDFIRNANDLPLQSVGLLSLGVAENAVFHFIGQVQPGAVFLDLLHRAHALGIVGETAGAQAVQRPLTGVTKGGVPQIVPQGNGLGEILIQLQRPGNGAGDLRHL